MGIILILIILSVLGIWLAVKGECEWWGSLGCIIGVFAILATIICVSISIIEYATANKYYTDLIETREVIEYRLEQTDDDKNLLINGGTYTDLLNYNKTIRTYKTYANNFWIGWFYADKIADLDYIELSKDVP